jgi:hypothetical protein
MGNEWEFYQIPHVGVPEPDKDAYTRTDVKTPIRRALDMKISNFGALWIGKRSTADKTKVVYGFEQKGYLEGAAEFGIHGWTQDAEMNENPLIWGSTVKYTRNDEMFKMGMDTDDKGTKSKSYPVSFPKFDVMDTNLVNASGLTHMKNWPSEGWRSFGGKYDFHEAYSGGGFTH